MEAVKNGAEEVDMVINIGALKDKNYTLVYEDIKAVVEAAHPKALVKVIIETSALTDEEKVIACELAKRAKADFVKTSTGFGSGGATVDDVRLMKRTVGDALPREGQHRHQRPRNHGQDDCRGRGAHGHEQGHSHHQGREAAGRQDRLLNGDFA